MTTKLTAHTLSDYQVEIPYPDLPRTFQDTVVFTRRLGIQYLWIDSLCIIQRDDEKDSAADRARSHQDWSQEADNMRSVFENSYLTLAALSVSNPTEGLFFRTKILELEATGIFARKISHEGKVLKRGWVFQESLLSPRTLSFTAVDLAWECRQMGVCQCSKETEDSTKFPAVCQLEALTHSGLIDQWYDLVSRYSETSLTYQSDKLKAIEGMKGLLVTFEKGPVSGGIVE